MDAIEKVLSEHLPAFQCDGDYGEKQWVECSCESEYFVDTEAGYSQHRAHVAAEIRKALGESETEYGVRWPSGRIDVMPSKPLRATSHDGRPGVIVCRSRSEWREVE